MILVTCGMTNNDTDGRNGV